MKKTEREKILKTYRLLNEEIEKAEKIVNEASNNCEKENYSNNSYQYYQQRYEYLKGLFMARSIFEKQLEEIKKEVNL